VDAVTHFNAQVKVKLTQTGWDIINKQYALMNERLRARGVEEEFTFDNVDEEGYSRFQIWDLMGRFGDYMRPGYLEPFHGEMVFIDCEVKEPVGKPPDKI
jgi:hypothetical protein